MSHNQQNTEMISERNKEKQGYIGNLIKKTDIEIREILDRQAKLLENTKFISKLPDKGQKIRRLKQELEEELQRRLTIVDEAADILSRMKIQDPEDLEWNQGKTCQNIVLDSDDDSDSEVDPLKLVSQHSGVVPMILRRVEPPEKKLITEDDVSEIESFNLPDKFFDVHSKLVCKKFGDKELKNDKFRPYMPKKLEEVKSATEKVKEVLGSKWEVTAATPPVPRHLQTKQLPLSESLILQKKYEIKLKEIQIRQAADRLSALSGVQIADVKFNFDTKAYRNPISEADNDKEFTKENDSESQIINLNCEELL